MTSAEKESHFRACYDILMKGYKDEHALTNEDSCTIWPEMCTNKEIS